MSGHIYYDLHDLFAQLGLPNDDANIESFIDQHKPLPCHVNLAQAPWWNPAQKYFIEEAFNEDADWTSAIDELNKLLR